MKNIKEFIDRDYVTDVRKNRRKGKGGTQEFFTPYSIIKRMCDKIPDDEWADPEKTFLEPCMGDGNIVCYIVWNRIQHGVDWQTTLKTLGGVELMNDNVKETKERVIDLLDKMNISYDKETAVEIMDKNLVCADFFNWDFEHWNYAIMNPPYSRNLHLKFLEKVIEVSDTVVSIQPVKWLEDIGGQLNEKSQYYKYENSISKHIYNLDKIEGNDATRIFGEGNVTISQKLAIYHCNKNGGYEYSLLNDVFPYKLYKKTELPFKIGEYKDHKNDNIVPIGNINGAVYRGCPSLVITTKYGAFNKGKNENNKTFEQLKHENPRFTFGNIDTTRVIIFDTYNEAQNFYDMCQTMFWKVICYKSTSGNHIPINVLPWPNNYKEKWTDEKLIKYFNLSDKDINEYKKIEKEITDILNSLKNKNKQKIH